MFPNSSAANGSLAVIIVSSTTTGLLTYVTSYFLKTFSNFLIDDEQLVGAPDGESRYQVSLTFSYDIFERNKKLIKSYKNISFSEKMYKGFEEKQKLVHILLKEREFLKDKIILFKRVIERSSIKI